MDSKESCQTIYSSASLEIKKSAETSQQFTTRSFDVIKKEHNISSSQIKICVRRNRKRYNKRMKSVPGSLAIRGRQSSKRKFYKKIDIRYAKEITNFFNKYSNFQPKQKCPKIEERLNVHKFECHLASSMDTSKNLREQGVMAIPSESQMLYSVEFKPPPVDMGSQTDITLSDNIGVPLKRCDTRVIEPKRHIYKEHLKNEILNWIQNIPIFYSNDFTEKYLKDNIVVMLLENINNLATQNCRGSYDGLVQKQIDDCLSILPMWLPNNKQDQCPFKNNLKDKLYQTIMELNSAFLETESANSSLIENMTNNHLSEHELGINNYKYIKEISDWLHEIKFSIPISQETITDHVMKRISAIINEDVPTKCYKFILQGKIKEVLDQLPVHLDYTEFKDLHMNKFAENLANRLFNVKKHVDIRTEKDFGTHKKSKIHGKHGRQIFQSSSYSNQLKQTIHQKVDNILKESKLDNRIGVKMEIYNKIVNSLETLHSGIDITSAIYEILRKRCIVTPDKAVSMAKKIKKSVENGLKQTEDMNNQFLSVMSVYRSNEDNCITSTPKKQTKIKIMNLNETPISRFNSTENTPNWAVDNLRHFEEEIQWEENMIPKSINILEDQISEWVKKQPFQIYVHSNENKRNEKIKILAHRLHNHLSSNNPEDVINSDVKQWLKEIIKPEENRHIGSLTLSLKEKINDVFQNKPLGVRNEHKIQESVHEILDISDDNSDIQIIPNREIPNKSDKTPNLEKSELIDRLEKNNRDTLKYKEFFSGNIKNKSVAQENPSMAIVEFIEEWCDQLPIDAEEDAKIIMKTDIAKKLYQKIGEFNINPEVFNDEKLYKDLLQDELDTIFENLPQNDELQRVSANLKGQLIGTILYLKKALEQKFAGTNYKHKLENTINASLPSPIQMQDVFEPGFEIYKKYLANKFILDNFDHSNEEIKSKYEKTIKYEIDKYFWSAQKKNAMPTTKEQMYNELYSALFKVPLPNEESMIDEVEEVKTRCEIDAWFECLPLEAVDDIIEMLEWDKMLTTLTKRVHKIEKNDSEPDSKIHLEIYKFLAKVPLLPDKKSVNHIEQYISDLKIALKSSADARKYVALDNISRKGKNILQNKNDVPNKNISQIPGPSCNGAKEDYSHTSHHEILSNNLVTVPYKSPADQIEDIVENWCNKLPWSGENFQYEKIKNDISTKITIKIFEMNMNPDIFNDDIVYDELLDEELDNIMSSLHLYCEFGQTNLASKYQLKEMIKSIKPLIKVDKDRYEYKTQLNELVEKLLHDQNETVADFAESQILKDEIVDNFIQFTYNKSDDDALQLYKTKIHDAVLKYDLNIINKGEKVDSLIKLNQLLCELAKIPMPSEAAMKKEIEQIKMKNEVKQLFKENNLDDHTEETEKMKKTLTKTLYDIEKSGHTEFNDSKMNADITKCFNKLGKKISPQVVQNFINTLKNNEEDRKKLHITERSQALTAPSDRDLIREQVYTSSFASLKAPVERSSRLPTAFTNFRSRSVTEQKCNRKLSYHQPNSVCQNCGQYSDFKSGNTESPGGFKRNINEPWNIYRPEIATSFASRSPDPLFQEPSGRPRSSYGSSQLPGSLIANFPPEQAVPLTLRTESKKSPHMEVFQNERHRCTCDTRNKCKRKQYCMIPIDEYCEECGGFRPRWCRVLMPRCPYLHF